MLRRVTKARCLVASLTTALAVVAPLSAQMGEGVPISGVVVDAQGKPVAGARLGTGWWFDQARLSCYGSQAIWSEGATPRPRRWQFVTTDAAGRFDARIRGKRGHIALTVFSGDGQFGAHRVWQAGAKLEDVSVQLLPVAKLHLDIRCPDLGHDRAPATAYLNAVPSGTRLGRFRCDGGVADVLLPPGTYELYVYGRDMETVKQRVTVKPSQELREAIELPATFFALHKGKRISPWSATAVRGLDEIPSFESFRGKWLIVSLWSAYRGGGAMRDIPQLIAFDRKWRVGHPGEEPPYAIVLLHTDGATDLKQLDAEIAKSDLRAKYWGNKPLPFPILLDAKEQTIKDWKIRYGNNVLLFDPGGLFVDRALDPELLERAVAGEVPTPTQVNVASPAQRRAPAGDTEWDQLVVRDRRRSMLDAMARTGDDPSAAWCRSLLWNPRQIYVPPEVRKRLAGVIDEQYRGIGDRATEVRTLRRKELEAAIAAKKLQPITKADLTEAELKAFDSLNRQMPGMSEASLIGNVVRDTRKLVVTQHRANEVYGAKVEELRRSWGAALRLRSEQKVAFWNVADAFFKAGVLTRAETKAARAEFEQMIGR